MADVISLHDYARQQTRRELSRLTGLSEGELEHIGQDVARQALASTADDAERLVRSIESPAAAEVHRAVLTARQLLAEGEDPERVLMVVLRGVLAEAVTWTLDDKLEVLHELDRETRRERQV